MRSQQKTDLREIGQLSMFDSILRDLRENDIPAESIGRMMKKLEEVKAAAEKREAENRRKEKEEREKRRRAEAEARERLHVEQVTCMDLPLSWENAFAGDGRAAGVHAESPADGLWLSLENLGRVDMEYIAEITDEPVRNVIEALRGSVYQNPETVG